MAGRAGHAGMSSGAPPAAGADPGGDRRRGAAGGVPGAHIRLGLTDAHPRPGDAGLGSHSPQKTTLAAQLCDDRVAVFNSAVTARFELLEDRDIRPVAAEQTGDSPVGALEKSTHLGRGKEQPLEPRRGIPAVAESEPKLTGHPAASLGTPLVGKVIGIVGLVGVATAGEDPGLAARDAGDPPQKRTEALRRSDQDRSCSRT